MISGNILPLEAEVRLIVGGGLANAQRVPQVRRIFSPYPFSGEINDQDVLSAIPCPSSVNPNFNSSNNYHLCREREKVKEKSLVAVGFSPPSGHVPCSCPS